MLGQPTALGGLGNLSNVEGDQSEATRAATTVSSVQLQGARSRCQPSFNSRKPVLRQRRLDPQQQLIGDPGPLTVHLNQFHGFKDTQFQSQMHQLIQSP